MLNQNLRHKKALLGKTMNTFRNLALAACGVILLSGAMPAQAQNNDGPSALEAGYRSAYNLQFDQAHRAFAEWQSQHPDDPMGPVSDAAVYLFSECDRLHILEAQFLADDKKTEKTNQLTPDPAVKTQFEAMLEKPGHCLKPNWPKIPAMSRRFLPASLWTACMAITLFWLMTRNGMD